MSLLDLLTGRDPILDMIRRVDSLGQALEKAVMPVDLKCFCATGPKVEDGRTWHTKQCREEAYWQGVFKATEAAQEWARR